ncbi:hypothetical protein JNL27_00980, partial [bacterium]|nr:hypothetical protein [bacterium]
MIDKKTEIKDEANTDKHLLKPGTEPQSDYSGGTNLSATKSRTKIVTKDVNMFYGEQQALI